MSSPITPAHLSLPLRRRRQAVPPASSGFNLFEEQQSTSLGLFTATGSPILYKEYMALKEALSTSPASRSRSSMTIRERHEPWLPPDMDTPRMCPSPQHRRTVDLDDSPKSSGSPMSRPISAAMSRPISSVAFHPLGMVSDLKFDPRASSYKFLAPGINKKIDRAIAMVENSGAPQDATVMFSKARYEKAKDFAALTQDLRNAFKEIAEEGKDQSNVPPKARSTRTRNTRSEKMPIERSAALTPTQARFNRQKTVPMMFFQSPPQTAPASPSASTRPRTLSKSIVPELVKMLRCNTAP